MARFEIVDGERSDDDPTSQDDEDALAALAAVIGGEKAVIDPEVAARAHALASDIMGLPGDTSTGLRSEDGPPAG